MRFSSLLALLSGFLLVTSFGIQANTLAIWTNAAFERQTDRNLATAERLVGDALEQKSYQWFANDAIADIKYQTDAIGSDIGFREWEGGIDLPLWWPGQKGLYREESGSSHAVADAMLQAIRLDLAGGVRQRSWDVALTRAERDQAVLSLGAAKQLLEDVSVRVDAGELPRSDALLVEKSVLTKQDEVYLAENRLQQSQAIFASYTGIGGDVEGQPEVQTAVQEIYANHPHLYLAQQYLVKARAHRNRVSADRRSGPNVWLGAKTTKALSRADYDDAVGIQLSIPLGSVAHAAPANAEAEQALTRALTDLENLQRKLDIALTQAKLELDGRSILAKRAEHRQNLAQESLKLSQRAFELGESDLIYLLRAQADANDARQSLLLNRLRHQRAIAMFNQASGVIPR